MARSGLAVALVLLAVSWADARDFCIQQDTGPYAGSQIVLKRARLARRVVNTISGYLAVYNPGSNSFSSFSPMSGQAIVNPLNQVVLGMTLYSVQIGSTFGGLSGSSNPGLNLQCNMGPDGVLDELDSCNGAVVGQSTSGHVVKCSALVALP